MPAHYPSYTYLFSSEENSRIIGQFRKMKKKYIKAVLRDLRLNAHHVYILLENLPENRFAITRYHDHVRNSIGSQNSFDCDSLSISQFR